MIITGHPTAAETAAVVAVLTTMSQEPAQDDPPRSAWADRSRLLRPPVHPGPGAWRASALPK